MVKVFLVIHTSLRDSQIKNGQYIAYKIVRFFEDFLQALFLGG